MIDAILRFGLLILFIVMIVFLTVAIVTCLMNDEEISAQCPNPFLCDTCPFPPCTQSEKDRMRSKHNQREIIEYLEYSYSGAKMSNDVETQLRISRAIAAFNADVNIEIFDKDFIEKYSQMYDWSITK